MSRMRGADARSTLKILGFPRLWMPGSLLAGCAVGLAYALSPVACWSILTMLLTWYLGARGLRPRERAIFSGLLSAAVVTRLLAIAAFVLTAETDAQSIPSMFGDESLLLRRSLWLRHIALGIPVLPSDFSEAYAVYGAGGFNYVLAALQTWFGEAPYGLRVASTSVFLVATVILYRVARRGFGPVPAMIGLGLVLFHPTSFVWSVSVLKESVNVFLNAVAILAAFIFAGTYGWRRTAAAGCVLLAIAGAAVHRPAAAAMLAGGLLVATGLYVLLSRRLTFVVGAAALPLTVWAVLQVPAVHSAVTGHVKRAALVHVANVQSPGHSYALLDSRFYVRPGAPPLDSMTTGEMMRFLVRAAVSFVTVPVPWKTVSRTEMMTIPQQMIWYGLVVLAIPGAVIGFRRHRWLTCLLAGVTLASMAVVAPATGNVGTLIRFRDLVMPVAFWVSALGIEAALRSVARDVPAGIPTILSSGAPR